MHRYILLIIVALVVPQSADAAFKPQQPNVIIFLSDDVGYGEYGFQGNKEIPTPNIDSIARNGVRFTQAYNAATYCSPCRAGLMTGRGLDRQTARQAVFLVPAVQCPARTAAGAAKVSRSVPADHGSEAENVRGHDVGDG